MVAHKTRDYIYTFIYIYVCVCMYSIHSCMCIGIHLCMYVCMYLLLYDRNYFHSFENYKHQNSPK